MQCEWSPFVYLPNSASWSPLVSPSIECSVQRPQSAKAVPPKFAAPAPYPSPLVSHRVRCSSLPRQASTAPRQVANDARKLTRWPGGCNGRQPHKPPPLSATLPPLGAMVQQLEHLTLPGTPTFSEAPPPPPPSPPGLPVQNNHSSRNAARLPGPQSHPGPAAGRPPVVGQPGAGAREPVVPRPEEEMHPGLPLWLPGEV